jgi:GT2 family glycosyltransferase
MNHADILVIGVIYNTYPETLRYLDSLLPSANGNLSLILVDNSDKLQPSDFIETIKGYSFLHYLKTNKNLGYFGGAREGLKYYLREHATYPQWILVTNVDIVFTPQFFQRLTELNNNQNLGVVAPSILSKKWNTDYNPKIPVRYSKGKLQFYKFLYSNFLIHNLFLIAAYAKKWCLGMWRVQKDLNENPFHMGRKIYAPHGSCLVFKDIYFTRGGTLNLPNFLFGEEILVAETALQSGLDVEYHPEMIIYDYEHASVGFWVSPKINMFYRDSVISILERYYS